MNGHCPGTTRIPCSWQNATAFALTEPLLVARYIQTRRMPRSNLPFEDWLVIHEKCFGSQDKNPSGAKARIFVAIGGTAKAVPFHKTRREHRENAFPPCDGGHGVGVELPRLRSRFRRGPSTALRRCSSSFTGDSPSGAKAQIFVAVSGTAKSRALPQNPSFIKPGYRSA